MSLCERLKRAIVGCAVLLEQMRRELRLGTTPEERLRALREQQEAAKRERLLQCERDLRAGRVLGDLREVQA